MKIQKKPKLGKVFIVLLRIGMLWAEQIEGRRELVDTGLFLPD